MSQSKISVADGAEKKFVIKHVFKDVMDMKDGDTVDGPIEYHYNIPWKIRVVNDDRDFLVFLDCLVRAEYQDWSIIVSGAGKLGERNYEGFQRIFEAHFNPGHQHFLIYHIPEQHSPKCIDDRNTTVELSIQINRMTGIPEKKKLRNFDNESAKKHSDVVIKIGGQDFYVNRMYLSFHSTYFDALLNGNFSESQKSEIELKDIDPEAFQDYLELIYGECLVKAHTVLGILHLADFFDSKTVVRRCQKFLVQKSELPLKQKFEAAIKYNLEELKTKCISEIKTVADLQSIVPEKANEIDYEIWKELFQKALALIPK